VGFFGRGGAQPFSRRSDGRYAVDLDDDLRELLGGLLSQLRELLTTDSPALVRLFPPPYQDDDERNEGYSVMAGAELIEGRLAAIDTVESTLGLEVLTEDQLQSWMRSTNDLRLVLGTMLDVDESGSTPEPDSPEAPMYAAYELLGAVLTDIVDALED
jgi:hypothetical protein